MAANRPKAPKAPNTPSATRERGGDPSGVGNAGGANPTSGGRRPQLNRAQIKAMEARAASTARAAAVARGEDSDTVTEVMRTATNLRTPRSHTREGLRTANRTVSTATAADFSIKTEMEYQRRDLVRLLLLAAVVIAIFAVLWFFLR